MGPRRVEPHGRTPREPVQVALLVGEREEGEARPCEPALGVVGRFGLDLGERAPADVVLATLQDRHAEAPVLARPREGGERARDLLIHGLLLQGARVGREAHAHAPGSRPEEGGEQVGQGLARPGWRVDQQQLLGPEHLRHGSRDLVLARTDALPRIEASFLRDQRRQVHLEEVVHQAQVVLEERVCIGCSRREGVLLLHADRLTEPPGSGAGEETGARQASLEGGREEAVRELDAHVEEAPGAAAPAGGELHEGQREAEP